MLGQYVRKLFGGGGVVQKAPPSFAVPEDVRVYAIGDIHGRAALLQEMLEVISEDAAQHPAGQVVEIFLGDYIDRGFHSRAVIEQLLAPSARGHHRIFLKGNHEEALLTFLEDPQKLREWGNYGGFATLASYGVDLPVSMSPEKITILRDAFGRALPPEHLHFFRQLQHFYMLGDYFFVHAGVRPQVALSEQRPRDYLWIREPFLSHEGYFERYIVHGHSPLTKAEVRHNRANLDISNAPQNSLCCLVLQGQERSTLTVMNDKD